MKESLEGVRVPIMVEVIDSILPFEGRTIFRFDMIGRILYS